MAQQELTIASILQELAEQYDSIVSEREIFDRVLARRPSQAKDPYSAIREKLRYGATQIGWVRLGEGQLIPLRVALQDLRFRIAPDSEELVDGMLSRLRFYPFISLNRTDLQLEDAAGHPLPVQASVRSIGSRLLDLVPTPALDLSDWFRREGFTQGDSIIVTIRRTVPLMLRLEHEPGAQFRGDEVAGQEHELLEALAQRIAHSRSDIIFAEDSVLPIYIRAPWRTDYPGRPWQQLVASDPRMRLIDGLYITNSSFRRPLDMLFGSNDSQLQTDLDQTMLQEIIDFQARVLTSRREDAIQGLWNGIAPRASTAHVVFDMQNGSSEMLYPGEVNSLQNYTETIETRAAQGDYEREVWIDADDEDLADEDFYSDLAFEDGLPTINDIEDLETYIEQNPAIVEATQRLMESLTPAELTQLQNAETPDQVQHILVGRLNQLLVSDPSLFVTLEPTPPSSDSNNGNGHAQGSYPAPPALELWDERPQPATSLWPVIEDEEDWDEDEDEEDWDEDEDEEQDQATARSSELMDDFHRALLTQGKSETTAASRTGDLWIYADFLAHYYNRALDAGDYATLDECLFFFYPRKVINSSPRRARELCTSIKQFYAFLHEQRIVADDTFAQAIWRRRDQAARVVELYAQIDSESPNFNRMFAHLFAPYTI